jgi:hypothetical protein
MSIRCSPQPGRLCVPPVPMCSLLYIYPYHQSPPAAWFCCACICCCAVAFSHLHLLKSGCTARYLDVASLSLSLSLLSLLSLFHPASLYSLDHSIYFHRRGYIYVTRTSFCCCSCPSSTCMLCNVTQTPCLVSPCLAFALPCLAFASLSPCLRRALPSPRFRLALPYLALPSSGVGRNPLMLHASGPYAMDAVLL